MIVLYACTYVCVQTRYVAPPAGQQPAVHLCIRLRLNLAMSLGFVPSICQFVFVSTLM